ncbi:hypothetical protein [Mesorhizobium carmichaelinearum]|uniref:hypothetical protein n=1 Tax=Mesorhizobium carmichaelinearum TaxID=1208188 RepID=UPI00117C4FE5|nr:hypothetical protein [Mesorhizobium carmichaelinearum]
MTTDDTVKQEMRLLAIEYMLMEIYNLVLVSSDTPEPVVEGFEQRLLENVDRITSVVADDPAMADHAAAELRDALADLMTGARQMRLQ